MEMASEEYFFYEWLIIEKGVTSEKSKQMTGQEFARLKCEYVEFLKKVNRRQ